jgi:hypothetical protein
MRPGKPFYRSSPWARPGVRRLAFVRKAVGLVVLLLLVASFPGWSGSADAALSKPTYIAGDRWVYVLTSTLDSFPGLNASQAGTIHFDLVGQAEVDILGSSSVVSGGVTIPTVAARTTTSGFLNGTFQLPGVGRAHVTGTFKSSASEDWEDRAYLVIRSNTTTTYTADVTFVITTQLVASLRANATTSVASIPPFDLDVGQSASASLQTHLVVNSTVTAAGRTQSSENRTDVSSLWRREVLSRESVSVEAGIFAAYKMNQTVGGFAGFVGLSGGTNETAYFSNDTGNYVKRDAYANGTRVAEMRLTSYSFGARASSFGLIDWLLIVVAVAAGSLLVFAYWRRRKKRLPGAPSGGSQPTAAEKKGGGDQGAH